MIRPSDPIAWESSLPIRPSSPAWRAVVRAVYGSPLTPDERATFLSLSGGVEPPAGGSSDVLVVAGRRGGKSETMARVATFEALHGGHHVALARGQRGRIVVISPLREQSQEILGYTRGLAALPQIRKRVAGVTADSVEFTNGIVVSVMTADAVAVSGPTIVCVIRDEWAKWPGPESATPDTAIESSLRPALAPVVGAPPRRILGITSAYLDEGLAYDTDRTCYGRPDAPTLVLRGSTIDFNPAIDRAWLERERRRDPRAFAREYECAWQSAVTEGWFGADTIEACVDRGRVRSPRIPGIEYVCAIDAAFRADAFTCAVAHAERRDDRAVAVLDRIAAWHAPKGGVLQVEPTVAAVVGIAKAYGCERVLADQYAAVPLAESFRRHDLRMVEIPWTNRSKPARFRRVRDAMTDGAVRLCDDAETIRELHNIQGKLLRSGGEQIEARRGHDDRVSAAVLALSEAMDRDARTPSPEAIATVWAIDLGTCGYSSVPVGSLFRCDDDDDWPKGWRR